MNKQNLPAMLDESKIEELLAKIRPKPGPAFFQKIEQASWRVNREQKVKANNLRPGWVIAMTVVILIVGILVVTPQGRAWAQEVFQFFKKMDSTAIPVSSRELEQYKDFTTTKESYSLPLIPVILPTPPPEMASLPGCDTAEKSQSYSCQIAYAESQLEFELMEFPEKPQNLEFQGLWFDKTTKSATIEYEAPNMGTYLSLTQRLGQAPEQEGGKWSWVPAGEVENIKVGPFEGEYVSGFFDLSTSSNEYIWKDTTLAQRIAWSDGAHWYLLDSSGILGRDRLMKLAESLVAIPVIENKRPDPEALDVTLASVAEAEAYSGLDLKAPTQLPLGFSFSYAHYTSFRKNEVSLRYDGNNTGVNGHIIIYEREEKYINFDSLSTTHGNYEIVKVNGQNAFYGFTEDGLEPHLFLWWQDGDMNYQLYFYWYNDAIHGLIDKQKMITIAESMDDVNIFKNRTLTPRSYEYVKIYAEALGIDIYEFSTVPAGWSFDNFGASAWEKCIGLSYTLPNAQGRLFLNQCGTARLFENFDIPVAAIEDTNVGKNKAQYIIGKRGYDSNGNLVWLYDLPVQQLRWKENGLWIQFIVHGEDTLIYDKEDLISFAETLR